MAESDLGSINAEQLDVLKQMAEQLRNLTDPLRSIAGGKKEGGAGGNAFAAGATLNLGQFAQPLQAVSQALIPFHSRVQGLTQALGQAMAPLKQTLVGAQSAFQAVTSAITPFVTALSPVQLEIFGEAIRDLQATVGAAFEGILPVFTGVIRNISDAIAPVMDALRPVFTDLATVIGDLLAVQARTLAEIFTQLVPLLQFLMPIVQVLGTILQGLNLIFRALFVAVSEVWKALLTAMGFDAGGFKEAMDSFRKTIMKAVAAVIVFIARVLKFFGAEGAIKALKKAFEPPKPGARKTAAPKEFGITGIEEVFKNAMLAAAGAGGGAEVKTTEDALAGIGQQLDEVLRTGTTLDAAIHKYGGPMIRLLEAINNGNLSIGQLIRWGANAILDTIATNLIPGFLRARPQNGGPR